MRFLDCKIKQLHTSNSHPHSQDEHVEGDLPVEQFLVTVLGLIMDAEEQLVKTAKKFAHTNYSGRQNGKLYKNRIILETTMEISGRLKQSDGRDKQILQAAAKKRDF